MIRIALIITLLCLTKLTIAQYSFDRSYDIIVNNGADPLTRAWEGGLNYPIFSNIDFNNDGKMDLVAFDKSGERLLLFDQIDLKFKPFNPNLVFERWVLFRDFNCDGLQDIFTGTSGGIRVYRNTGNLNFVQEQSILKSDYTTFNSNLYVSNLDIPGIVDLDGDGDLDILSFEINGTRVEMHKNLSQEQFNNCDQLTFKLNTKCWGNFTENPTTNNIDLNQPCTPVQKKEAAEQRRHTGSTITTLDQNKDGDIEIIVGDISFNNLIYLDNGGTSTNANITDTNLNFPNYNSSVDFHTFPYASYVDVDFDGKNDLISVSNDKNNGDNKKVVFHKNVGVLNDTFNFESSTFLVDEMLDFGAGAYPVFIDEDQDGLMDLLIGNSGENSNGTKTGKVALLRNIGSLGNPSFNVVSYDYLNLSALNQTYFYPAIGDIDGDGDDDLFLGLEDGSISFYKNTAGAGNSCNFLLENSTYSAIDIGSFAAPQLFDVNDDNLLDFIVGTQNGSLTYFQNDGSVTTPSFGLKEENFGGISTQDFNTGAFFGYATPHFFKDNDTTRILVGSEKGGIYYYHNLDSLDNGNIKLNSVDFEQTKDGGRSAVVTHDLNQDSYLDLFIGNLSGGLAYHQGIFHNSVSPIKYYPDVKFTINNNSLKINNLEFNNYSIYSTSGKLIKKGNNSNNSISLVDLSRGVYLGIIESKGKKISFKFIK